MRCGRVRPLRLAVSPASASGLERFWSRWVSPAEWRGAYSVEKVVALLEYSASSNSRLRVGLVLVLTPLPALAVCVLCEVVLPLNDPPRGWRHNGAFFLRAWIRLGLTSFLVDSQIELYIPVLRLPKYRLVLMNAVQSAAAVGAMVAIAEATRAFPIPFTQVVTAPIYVACSWSLRWLCDRATRQRDPNPRATQQRVASVMRLLNFSVLLIYLYSGFGVVFAHASEHWRVPLSVVLVLLKAFATRGEWKRTQDLTESGHNDFATAHVSFGVQLFHALFVSASLQKSSSLATLVVVVAIAATHDVVMIRELKRRTDRVHEMAHQRVEEHATLSVMDTKLHLLATRSLRHVSVSNQVKLFASRSVAVAMSAPRKTAFPLNTDETEYLAATQSLLQSREATLLRLYVDAFAPIVFFTYVAAIKYLPNGQFLPFLATHDLSKLALRLGVPLGVKLMTWMVLLRVLHRTNESNRHVPGLTQLAFALDRMVVVVQGRSLFIAMCIFDFSLLHNGNDLTFQFRWLRSAPSVTA